MARQDDAITGFGWSENLGWVSLNCYNDINADGLKEDHCAVSDYGVDLTGTAISGEAWSEYLGWGCFGSTCTSWAGVGLAPDLSSPVASYDKITGLVSGWANFPVLGADGWMKLNGNAVAYGGAYPLCINCQSGSCGICFTKANFQGSEYICRDCTTCAEGGVPLVYSCASCSACEDYGLAMDFNTNKLVGWAWNGDLAKQKGMGWVKFHGDYGPAEVFAPYLETKQGDIYSKSDIGNIKTFTPPSGQNNATYLLLANGTITHFSQETKPDSLWQKPVFGDILFPGLSTGYSNVLGKLDLAGILAGQYGKVKTILSQADIETILAGKVYYKNGDLNINSARTFNLGTDNIKGNGLVVVKGDLNINSNIYYAAGNPLKLTALPSIGWLVIDDGTGTKGNINIAPSVF